MEINDIKDKIENKIVALAGVNQYNKPHAIAVEVNKVENNKIIITDNQMKTTINNIKNNPNVSLVFWGGEKGWRIDGEVEYHDSGEWLDFVKALEENAGLPAKGALVINVEGVKELG